MRALVKCVRKFGVLTLGALIMYEALRLRARLTSKLFKLDVNEPSAALRAATIHNATGRALPRPAPTVDRRGLHGVLHHCSGEAYSGIAQLSYANALEYTSRHKYALHDANSTSFPTGAFFTPKAWLKLAFMLHLLESHQYEWLLWTDCDVLIKNVSESIDDLIKCLHVLPQHDVIVAKDATAESPFNTGVMLVRGRSLWTRETVARALLLAEDSTIRNHVWWEQRALGVLYNENKHNEQSKMLIVQERWRLNAFAFLNEERDSSFAWHRVNCRERNTCDAAFQKKYSQIHSIDAYD